MLAGSSPTADTPPRGRSHYEKCSSVAFFRSGAEVVGCAFTEGVARYRRRASVETVRIGGEGFCSLEVDEIRPQIARFAFGSVETIRLSGCHWDEVFDLE